MKQPLLQVIDDEFITSLYTGIYEVIEMQWKSGIPISVKAIGRLHQRELLFDVFGTGNNTELISQMGRFKAKFVE